MLIFHCAGDEKRRRKSGVFISENSNRTLDRTRSRVDLRVRSVQTAGRDARMKVTDRRVRSLMEPERPITHPVGSACLSTDRTSWGIRSRATGRVRSCEELSRLQSDVMARPVTCDRTRPIASGPLLDSNRTPGVTRPVSSAACPIGASRARVLCDRRVRSFRPARPVNERRAASRA
jgi:hypothetical protein